MPAKPVYAAIVLCTLILFSCNSKKEGPATAATTPQQIMDTVQLSAANAIDVLQYVDGFLQNSVQKFTAQSQKISVITAKNGLKVTVDTAVLQKEDGTPVNDKIDVSIIELTSSADLFKSNAATVSDGRLLTSGGSYYIGMESNGQKITIKKNKTLQVDFPKLKGSEMELFYGERNTDGNMNWKAGQPLSFNTETDYRGFNKPYNPPYPDTVDDKKGKSKYFLFDSLNTKVFFCGKLTPLQEVVSMLQKRGIDKVIDTVFLSWRNLSCFSTYNSNLYVSKKYRMISCKELEAEKDSLAKMSKVQQEHYLANEKYAEAYEKAREENSITGQLQKYYSPAGVARLGWINCDRFYNAPENIEIPVEIPITLNNPQIQYFIIYKSFNGLMNGTLNTASKYVLSNLPVGEPVTLIAFTKTKGQLFQCRQDFVIKKDQKLHLDFTSISAAEMSKIFGKNVRI